MAFTAAASSSVADISPVFVQTNGYQTPSKIVRSLLNFEVFAGGQDVNVQQLGLGIWVVQHEGLTGDGSADVINDFQQDFYYWTTLFITPGSSLVQQKQYPLVDIRTSRRLRGGYGLLFKAQNPAQEETMALNVSMRNLWVLE